MHPFPKKIVVISVAAVATTSLSPAAAWQSGSGSLVMWDSNCDFFGNDLYPINRPSTECGQICVGDTRCTHWAWEPNYGCWIKGGSNPTRTEANGRGCGYVIGRITTKHSRSIYTRKLRTHEIMKPTSISANSPTRALSDDDNLRPPFEKPDDRPTRALSDDDNLRPPFEKPGDRPTRALSDDDNLRPPFEKPGDRPTRALSDDDNLRPPFEKPGDRPSRF